MNSAPESRDDDDRPSATRIKKFILYLGILSYLNLYFVYQISSGRRRDYALNVTYECQLGHAAQ